MLNKDKTVLFFVVEFEYKKDVVDDDSVYDTDEDNSEDGDSDG